MINVRITENYEITVIASTREQAHSQLNYLQNKDGYFCTVEELRELFTDWDTYRIGQAQSGEYWNKNMSEIFDQWLASKEKAE
jgi:hypothetical protein